MQQSCFGNALGFLSRDQIVRFLLSYVSLRFNMASSRATQASLIIFFIHVNYFTDAGRCVRYELQGSAKDDVKQKTYHGSRDTSLNETDRLNERISIYQEMEVRGYRQTKCIGCLIPGPEYAVTKADPDALVQPAQPFGYARAFLANWGFKADNRGWPKMDYFPGSPFPF